MENSVISIRTADGNLFPVLDEGSGTRKRLVLTTVRDDQQSVHIDLYRGSSDAPDQQYVGSLAIDDLPPGPAGEAEVTLVLGIDADGNLSAEAADGGGGGRQSLTVQLTQDLEWSPPPDFSLTSSDDALPDSDVLPEEFGPEEFAEELDEAGTVESEERVTTTFRIPGSDEEPEYPYAPHESLSAPEGRGETAAESGKPSRLLFVAYLLLAFAILAAGTFLVYRMLEGEPAPPLEAHAAVQAARATAAFGLG